MGLEIAQSNYAGKGTLTDPECSNARWKRRNNQSLGRSQAQPQERNKGSRSAESAYQLHVTFVDVFIFDRARAEGRRPTLGAFSARMASLVTDPNSFMRAKSAYQLHAPFLGVLSSTERLPR
jgi:hypothetical protein